MSDLPKPKKDWKQHQITAVNINEVCPFKIWNYLCEYKQDKSWCNFIYRLEVFALEFTDLLRYSFYFLKTLWKFLKTSNNVKNVTRINVF